MTVLAHFGDGAGAGTVYAPRSRGVPLPPVAGGIAYGLVVWTASYLGLLPVVGLISPAINHPARRNALMIVAHVVWGATLALLLEHLDAQA